MGAEDNIEIVRRSLTDSEASPALHSDDLVWHFAGDVEGIAPEYRGKEAVYRDFFARLLELTDGTFAVEPVEIWGVGDDLVVAHLRISMTVNGASRSGAGVVVYRVLDRLIVEAYDIPASALVS